MIKAVFKHFKSLRARPKKRRRQVAAICYRKTRKGKRVLLITSRRTRRWIVPKGWPIKGMNEAEAAMQEAWEEAGVKDAEVNAAPVGTYDYDKYRKNGDVTPIEARVYVAEVENLAEEYPEENQRDRRWFSPKDAAKRVSEPGLKALLRSL
jgi:8-oxo-dGTP pyrophosphatase MutT (NUDIX family)